MGNPRQHVISPRALAATAVILALIAVGMIRLIPTIGHLGQLGNGGGFLIVKFLIAIVLIIVVGRLGGWVAARCRQPRVVGEMVAGITLGPALLGQFAPEARKTLFPAEVIPHLNLIAQLAIITFVFLLGANLPLELLRGSGRRVAVVGVGMVAIPLTCGILLAIDLSRGYRPDGVALLPFLLFIGTSMSVTAFPVLVRILAEHNLVRSRIGTFGLTAAGIGDVIAWCLLVVVVATVHSDSVVGIIPTVALIIVFVVAIWTVLRPALRQFLTFAEKNTALRFSSAAVLLLSAMSGAFITDWIGVHTIFGAFLVGMALPRENLIVHDLTRTIERGVTIVLPLFFAVVGFNVQLGFLRNPQDFLVCGFIILVAMASKIGTTTLIARSTRLTWRESMGLGVMVNCRGLTELVVVSTGLSLGIIGQNMFVMFVVMTLVTTIMTGPLLGRLKLDSVGPDGLAVVQPEAVNRAFLLVPAGSFDPMPGARSLDRRALRALPTANHAADVDRSGVAPAPPGHRRPHPDVRMDLTADTGLRLNAYTAEPPAEPISAQQAPAVAASGDRPETSPPPSSPDKPR